VLFILVGGTLKESEKAKAFKFGLMALNMKVIGKMIWLMAEGD
jgi:hypothetical protein